MDIDIYVFDGSPSCTTVLMVARYLNIKLNVKTLEWNNMEHMSETFLKMNPRHCAPTIVDDGFVLWESRAISTYLVNQYSQRSSLYPSDPKKRAVIDQLLQFDIGSLMNNLFAYCEPAFWGKEFNEEFHGKLKDSLNYLDSIFESNHYVAGDGLTLADLSILSSLSLGDYVYYDYSQWKNINQWVLRMKKELPYYDEIVTANVNHGRDYIKSVRQK